MDTAKFPYYPFLTLTAQYVAKLNTPVDHILTYRSFGITRYRAQSRILQALKGEIVHDDSINSTAELFSYPIARVLISCINDAFLIRRYAFAEAKFAYKMMKQEDTQTLQEIGQDLNIYARSTESGFSIHFTDYIKGAAGMRSLNWKLVNRKLKSGYVNITKEEYNRLLQEAITTRIMVALPLDIPDELCNALKEYINEIKTNLDVFRAQFDDAEFGDVEPESFPPCIVHLLSGAQSGINLAHSARFALTSFLLNIGLSVDQIIQMFNVSPDFNEEMTRYQVGHIAGATGTSYKPPSCNTMITYGNCFGKDELCKTINHPLNYYIKRKMKEKNQRKV